MHAIRRACGRTAAGLGGRASRPAVEGPAGRTADHLAPAHHPSWALDPVEELLGPVVDPSSRDRTGHSLAAAGLLA